MSVREYVDSLFGGYGDSDDMMDFKEEVCGNLQERIDYLIKKGASKEDAFKKATAELGDISEIADQISNNKRKEIIEDMYMKTRNYMNKRHIIGYIIAGGMLALGILFTLSIYFTGRDLTAAITSLIPFFIAPVCGFVFLGLTQETARNRPMNWKRALVYTLAVGLILFGLIVSASIWLGYDGQGRNTFAAIASLIPFVLPGSIVLAFLLLTEKSRHKPWVIEQEAVWAERMKEQFADPYTATKFGLLSGALWIFAIALFAAIGFLIGFQYSWLVFLFAVAAQVFMQALMTPKKKDEK